MTQPATARRITVVGAGSGYMPGVIRGLLHRADDLAGSDLVFYDPDAGHLDLMARLARRMFAARGASFTVRTETDPKAALDGTDFVFTTFRPGGLPARRLDETIPLGHGVVGQETNGPGGFFMACRSVPVLLDLARTVEQVAPGAWICNYTNPTNIVTAAVTRYSGARIIGLCDQFAGDQAMWARLLDLPPDRLDIDWTGLNHATWALRVRVDGADVTADVARRVAEIPVPDDPDEAKLVAIARAQGLLPNSYLRFYYAHAEMLAEARAKPTTRADDIMAMLPAYYSSVEREAERDDPDPSRERGGGDHGEFAIDTICAVARDERRRLIVNTVNRGALRDLDDSGIVEVPSIVGAQGPVPLVMGELPVQVRGLTQAIHAYESLTAQAAATGDRRIALQALMAHPNVRSQSAAERILDEGLAAHRAYLPQFA